MKFATKTFEKNFSNIEYIKISERFTAVVFDKGAHEICVFCDSYKMEGNNRKILQPIYVPGFVHVLIAQWDFSKLTITYKDINKKIK